MGAQQTSVTAVTTSVLIPGSPHWTMVHAPAHPLHARRGWGLHLKCKSQTFSTGCYDFPPSLVPVLHFLFFLPPLSPPPSPPCCNTPSLKFWCICSVLWNENVVLNFSDIVKRGWAWQVEVALIYSKSHFWSVRFSCGISRDDLKLPTWICVVSGGFRQDRGGRGMWPHGEWQPSPEINIRYLLSSFIQM